jgi:hypothetical protein
MICLFCIGFIGQSRRFTDLANQQWALFYSAYIHLPMLFVLYSNAGLIDIVIIIDRIAIMSSSNRLSFVKRSRPYLVCFVLFLVALGLNFTVWFYYVPTTWVVSISATEWITFNTLNITSFFNSYVGQLIIDLQMALRDIFAFVAQFLLNLASLFMLKKHLNKKSKILLGKKSRVLKVASQPPAGDRSKVVNLSRFNNNSSSLSIELSKFQVKPNAMPTTSHNINKQSPNSINKASKAPLTIKSIIPNKQAKLSRADLSATLMVSILTLISMIEHIVFFLAMLNRWSPIS